MRLVPNSWLLLLLLLIHRGPLPWLTPWNDDFCFMVFRGLRPPFHRFECAHSILYSGVMSSISSTWRLLSGRVHV